MKATNCYEMFGLFSEDWSAKCIMWSKSRSPSPSYSPPRDRPAHIRNRGREDRTEMENKQRQWEEEYRRQQDEAELHCDICNVWTRNPREMQEHREGQNHRKKCGKVQRFRCTLCMVDVPCQVLT